MADGALLSQLIASPDASGGLPLSMLAGNSAAGAALGGTEQAPSLLDQATAKYPFISQHNPVVVVNPQKDRGYAETWPAGEPGDESYPRPKTLPIDRTGVEIYRPNEFGPDDLAAEMIHVDPKANATRNQIMQSFTGKQISDMASRSLDYQETQEPSRKLQNGVDAMLRGMVMGQKTDSVVDLTPDQQAMVAKLKAYATGSK